MAAKANPKPIVNIGTTWAGRPGNLKQYHLATFNTAAMHHLDGETNVRILVEPEHLTVMLGTGNTMRGKGQVQITNDDIWDRRHNVTGKYELVLKDEDTYYFRKDGVNYEVEL